MLHWPWVTAIHGYLLQKSLPSNEKGMFFIGGTFAMAIQIGINGFGRIGRVAFRIVDASMRIPVKMVRNGGWAAVIE